MLLFIAFSFSLSRWTLFFIKVVILKSSNLRLQRIPSQWTWVSSFVGRNFNWYLIELKLVCGIVWYRFNNGLFKGRGRDIEFNLAFIKFGERLWYFISWVKSIEMIFFVLLIWYWHTGWKFRRFKIYFLLRITFYFIF